MKKKSTTVVITGLVTLGALALICRLKKSDKKDQERITQEGCIHLICIHICVCLLMNLKYIEIRC